MRKKKAPAAPPEQDTSGRGSLVRVRSEVGPVPPARFRVVLIRLNFETKLLPRGNFHCCCSPAPEGAGLLPRPPCLSCGCESCGCELTLSALLFWLKGFFPFLLSLSFSFFLLFLPPPMRALAVLQGLHPPSTSPISLKRFTAPLCLS